MITDSLYTYRRIHFISGNAPFSDNLSSVFIRDDRMSQRPPSPAAAC